MPTESDVLDIQCLCSSMGFGGVCLWESICGWASIDPITMNKCWRVQEKYINYEEVVFSSKFRQKNQPLEAHSATTVTGILDWVLLPVSYFCLDRKNKGINQLPVLQSEWSSFKVNNGISIRQLYNPLIVTHNIWIFYVQVRSSRVFPIRVYRIGDPIFSEQRLRAKNFDRPKFPLKKNSSCY